MNGKINYNIMQKSKFNKRMVELSEEMIEEGVNPKNSKLYKSVQDKMSNLDKVITK